MEINIITEHIIGAAMRVHRQLGPGLLESTYEACTYYELRKQGLECERQKPVPVSYDGTLLECGYRIDLLVERAVVVELKAVERYDPIHFAQLLTYLKLSGHTVGLLINFNEVLVKHGIKRVVYNHSDSSPRALRSLR